MRQGDEQLLIRDLKHLQLRWRRESCQISFVKVIDYKSN